MKTFFRAVAYSLLAIILSGITFLAFSPQFGEGLSSEQKIIYEKYSNFYEGVFHNIEPREDSGDVHLYEFFSTENNKRPVAEIPSEKINYSDFLKVSEKEVKLIWLGHSALMINYNGKIILLDPMLGKYAAPFPIVKRFQVKHQLDIDELPKIDAIIISHDHYDHLDYGTINKLRTKVAKFIVPVGVGNHLKKWGVHESKIVELYWSDKIVFRGVEIICLPARHFSGRSLFDQNTTLWASWALIGSAGKIFWSGNSGYGKHLRDIGNKYGPFDLALLDGGQYNKAWADSHMFPDQTVLAAKELNANTFMPIHWSAFTLSTHSWTEPIEKSIPVAKRMNQAIIFPKIGEIFNLNGPPLDQQQWWQ